MTAGATTATLKLAYVFVPSPNPIRAFAGGVNPNQFDLQVIVSSPILSPVTIRDMSSKLVVF